MMNRPEHETLLAVLAGDTQAFNRLVQIHREGAMLLAMRLLRSKQDAEDSVQDGFVRAWEELPHFRGDCSFSSWLYRIIYNVSLNKLRSRKLRQTLRLSDERSDDELQINPRSEDPLPDQVAMNQERQEQLTCAIKRLPNKQRSVFIMRHVQGLTNSEIAKMTGKTEGSVKANFSFAVSRLKRSLEEYQYA